MSAAEIVNIQTTLQTRPLEGAGFGIALLALVLSGPQGTAWTATHGSARVITATPGDWRTVLAGIGVTSSDAIYAAVRTFFTSQADGPVPDRIKLARRATPVAQVERVQIVATTNGLFRILLGGVEIAAFTAAGSTLQQIRDGLVADLGASPVTVNGITLTYATFGTDAIDFTAQTAGVQFDLSTTHATNNAAITSTITTPSVGIVNDLALWIAEDNNWYALAELSRDTGVILNAAAEIETTGQNGQPGKIFIFQSDDSAANTNATTDVLSLMGPLGLNYARTAGFYDVADTDYCDLAWLSRMLPKAPGAASWANQPLSSVTGAEYQSTANFRAKNWSWLEAFPASQGGFAMTQGGRVAAGFTLKNIQGRDWLNNRILVAMLQLLRNNDVVDFEEEGISQCEAALRGPLDEAVEARFIVSYSIFPPDSASISAAQKATGRLPLLSWTAIPRDAIEGFDLISGSISQQ